MPLAVVAVALLQGVLLWVLHRLALADVPPWSELVFLLPAYACCIGLPLTYELLRSRSTGRASSRAVAMVAAVLAATAAYVGWVNGPVGALRPDAGGAVAVYVVAATLAWFVALPFVCCGWRGCFAAEGYAAIYDEAWRTVIALGLGVAFLGFFWSLLGLFVGLFHGLDVDWPRQVVGAPAFYYPVTCVAGGIAIALADVRPEMFRALRGLLLALLRALAVVAAVIVLLFLGALLVEGVEPLWQTRFAASGVMALGIALVALANAVWEDGADEARLPWPLVWPVRAALIVGPALPLLAFWALGLRLRQHGVSEDRLYATTLATVLAAHLAGYCVVAVGGRRAPFRIRDVNVVMALVVIAVAVAVQSPLVDFKRVAAAARMARLPGTVDFDYRYLRFDLGRHGLRALQALARSDTPGVAADATHALAEANHGDASVATRGTPDEADRARVLARFEVYPEGRRLPEDLVAHFAVTHARDRLALPCIDHGPPCVAQLIDLDGDGRDEAVVLFSYNGSVYGRGNGGWAKVGDLFPGRIAVEEERRESLRRQDVARLPVPRYSGLSLGTHAYYFMPCTPGVGGCPDVDEPRAPTH